MTTPTPPCIGRPRTPAGQLTPHELAVVAELARGGSYTQIGRRLGITKTAVATTISRAGRRLGTTTSAHLVATAIGRRLIPAAVAIRPAAAAGPSADVVQRVARALAARDWLADTADAGWWASRSPRFREDYLAAARQVIALVEEEPRSGP